jgi:hypothetical protein
MNQIIDISNEVNSPYEFAQMVTTTADTVQAKRILQKVYKHLAEFVHIEMRPSSVSFINKNRKSCRIIFYDIDALFKQKDLFVVIFYAAKRENLSEASNENFFETDWKIAMSMLGTPTILCYASQELSDGNWFNLVLFTHEEKKHTVTAVPLHHHAAYELAPERFAWIRLHNAVLPGGILEHKRIVMTKSKYYNFDDNWFAFRDYRPT